MSTIHPSPLSSRLSAKASLIPPSRNWTGTSKWTDPKSDSSSQSFPSRSMVTSSFQGFRPKFLESSLSLFFLSHRPFGLSALLGFLSSVSSKHSFASPSLLLSTSNPSSSLAWLLQWCPKYPSWVHPCPSTGQATWRTLSWIVESSHSSAENPSIVSHLAQGKSKGKDKFKVF